MNTHTFAKMTRTAVAAAAIAVSALPLSASAGIVFQSVSDLSDTSQFTLAWCSSCSNQYRIFDQFTLSSAATITGFSVDLYSLYGYWGSGLNFSIWSLNGNLPGTQLFSQNLANADFSTTTLSSNALLASTNNVSGLTLAAGTYEVSFYNKNLAVWGYTGGGGNLYQQGNQFHTGTSAAFTLTGAESTSVPEPTALALTALALVCAAGALRRRGA
ncbi:PEP-CTERM sorting domain-containing protein [Roseateles koreensis]|uniref:PEP-CTERM sorting domain-containing protein n=1 Tax=Roseateles koreensis TaxID=2987526 RepID=A0ABT5KRJ6_9BURK|nr:PEP-CTERM sorting domain-containing protein [Roseateles koreensis]MDC8785550.1 PEP-CTERM sorting domain-containing protein [Roseateles koreensis]